MPPTTTTRSSASVLFAFVATAALLFGYVGADLGSRLADAALPDVKQYVEKGGSIETSRLDTYHRLPITGAVLFCVLGAFAGRGFYVAWQKPATA
jgi:hypothetical protein